MAVRLAFISYSRPIELYSIQSKMNINEFNSIITQLALNSAISSANRLALFLVFFPYNSSLVSSHDRGGGREPRVDEACEERIETKNGRIHVAQEE